MTALAWQEGHRDCPGTFALGARIMRATRVMRVRVRVRVRVITMFSSVDPGLGLGL